MTRSCVRSWLGSEDVRSTPRGAGLATVVVSSTLRDLLIGSGLRFEERGAHQLKGVRGEWRLFAVASA